MMPEVLKEAARKFVFSEEKTKHVEVKVTVVIEKGWGPPLKIFDVDGGRLEELTKVAEAVGAGFKIIEVQDRRRDIFALPIFRLIVAHVAQQEELLTKLEFKISTFSDSEITELFFSLQQASKEWSLLHLHATISYPRKFWEPLARISANGSIGTFHIHVYHRLEHPGAKLNDLKRVWRMSEKLFLYFYNDNVEFKEIGGGKGAGTDEAEWQRMLQLLFEV